MTDNAPLPSSAVIFGDNMDVLPQLPDESFQMIYIDPPFNTGSTQKRTVLTTTRNIGGTRTGFQGQRYSVTKGETTSYEDSYEDFPAFIRPRLEEAYRLLHQTGTLYVHLDWREVHYVKVMLDGIFGRENFLNEIIWAYDYGAKSQSKWPTKHDTILVYVKDISSYYFSNADVDREPYMAPGLVTPEKVAKGKLPTDVWWHTIVSPNGKEKTGYPTQKPEGVVRRAVVASSKPGDWVLDFFGGSGTTAAVAAKNERNFVTMDSNPESITVMGKRLPASTLYLGTDLQPLSDDDAPETSGAPSTLF